jgi:hypothetical protein
MKLIDPKMSIDTIKSYIEVWDCKGCLKDGGTQHNVMSVDDLLCLPTIEAEPVRHGRWKKKNGEIYCTNCKKSKWSESFELMLRGFDFCPHCGAKMDATDTNVGGKGG